MNILLAFSPFVAFALIDRLVGSIEGLIAGAAVSLVLLVRDFLTPGKSPKLLEIGTFLLFSGLSVYSLIIRPEWSVIAVRLIVDIGLLAIVLFTLLIGKPFTLQYAREQVDLRIAETIEFRRANLVISSVWAVALSVMVLAEAAILLFPNMHGGIAVIILALVGAVKFTGWYSGRAKADTKQDTVR